jgi:hypothetical protein
MSGVGDVVLMILFFHMTIVPRVLSMFFLYIFTNLPFYFSPRIQALNTQHIHFSAKLLLLDFSTFLLGFEKFTKSVYFRHITNLSNLRPNHLLLKHTRKTL